MVVACRQNDNGLGSSCGPGLLSGGSTLPTSGQALKVDATGDVLGDVQIFWK
jgi:hypothetical protein